MGHSFYFKEGKNMAKISTVRDRIESELKTKVEKLCCRVL